MASAPGRVTVDGYKWTEFDDKAHHLPATAKEIVAEWAVEQPQRGARGKH